MTSVSKPSSVGTVPVYPCDAADIDDALGAIWRAESADVDGTGLGTADGADVGVMVGTADGREDGIGEGPADGWALGTGDGHGLGKGDGPDDGTGEGPELGKDDGAIDGNDEGAPVGVHVYTDESVSQHGLPMSLPVDKSQPLEKLLDSASTSVGISEQSLFDANANLAVMDDSWPNSDGTEPVILFWLATNQLATAAH